MDKTTNHQKCSICIMFDCGIKCQCKCHYGCTDKIRQDLDSHSNTLEVKSEEQAMEGLSALFS